MHESEDEPINGNANNSFFPIIIVSPQRPGAMFQFAHIVQRVVIFTQTSAPSIRCVPAES